MRGVNGGKTGTPLSRADGVGNGIREDCAVGDDWKCR